MLLQVVKEIGGDVGRFWTSVNITCGCNANKYTCERDTLDTFAHPQQLGELTSILSKPLWPDLLAERYLLLNREHSHLSGR